MYERNPRNADFIDLPFDDDQKLIAGQWIYRVNDDVAFRLNDGFIIDICMNLMWEEYKFSLMNWSIYDQNNICDHKKIKIEYLYFCFDLDMIVWR